QGLFLAEAARRILREKTASPLDRRHLPHPRHATLRGTPLEEPPSVPRRGEDDRVDLDRRGPGLRRRELRDASLLPRDAESGDRTALARGIPRCADEGSELHQRLVPFARLLRGDQ